LNLNDIDYDTDIEAYVRHLTILHDSTRVYRFSKELLALIENLVAFSPYYVANDPNAAGPIDIYYNEALNKYALTFCRASSSKDFKSGTKNGRQTRNSTLMVQRKMQVPDTAGPTSASVGYSTTRRTAGPEEGSPPPPERAVAGANAATTQATPK
jgi:hypothetical protein